MSTRQQEEVAVQRFHGMMLQRLAENRHKTYWREGNQYAVMENLFSLLCLEVEELRLRCGEDADRGDFETIRSEAADVANFAMMIYDLTLRPAVSNRESSDGASFTWDDVELLKTVVGLPAVDGEAPVSARGRALLDLSHRIASLLHCS